MDDIRRPHQPQRRDYTVPPHRRPAEHVTDLRPQPPLPAPHQPQPTQPPAHPHHAPAQHEPAHPTHSQPAHNTHPQPAHHMPDYQPAEPHHQLEHHRPPAAPMPQTAARRRAKRRGLKLAILVLIPFVLAGIFAAGYALRSQKDSNGIPSSIVKQANFDLFFPSPMPPGYIYMKDTATFQVGQVFYKFANGNKRVTVNEQPLGQNKPDLSQLPGYVPLDSPVGKAAIGTTFGEPTAVVVTSSTIITMNSTGGVNPADLKAAVANLKNIGKNPTKNSNG